MILSTPHIDVNQDTSNPSIILQEQSIKSCYEFPDPNSYYIVSDAGKSYVIEENDSIVLNFKKGYYNQSFSIDQSRVSTIEFAKELYKGSTPMEGELLAVLKSAMKKSAKKNPTLKNRM